MRTRWFAPKRNMFEIVSLSLCSSKVLDQEPDKLDVALQDITEADVVFLYRSSEAFWYIIEVRLKELEKGAAG